MPDYIKKPPLGLRPRLFHNEQRYMEVCGAISRYWADNREVPIEWVEEYNELLIYLKSKGSVIVESNSDSPCQ